MRQRQAGASQSENNGSWRIAATVRCWTLIFAVAILVCGAFHPAQAQLLDQLISASTPGYANEAGVTVTSRQRPEYDPIGIRLGNFTIRPQLSETVGYDDNVFGTKSARGSAVVDSNARVQADYDSSNLTGSAYLSVDDMRFLNQQSQSYTNWSAGLRGSYNVGEDTLAVSFDHLNVTQTSRDLDVPLLDQALAYRVDVLQASYKKVFNRVFVQPGVTLASYDYDNGTADGQPYFQNYRNRVEVTPNVIFGYELAPRRNLVLVVRDSIANYSSANFDLPRRNYNDVQVLAGIDYDVTGLWRYRLLAGYESRTFNNRLYQSIQAPIVEAAVIWSPTGLTSVTASATRHVEDSADSNSVGYTETALSLRVDHELLRNVLLQANAGYYLDEYEQNEGNQSLYRIGAGATWLMNRNMQLIGSYDFSSRQSSGGAGFNVNPGQQAIGADYTENRFLLTLRLAM